MIEILWIFRRLSISSSLITTFLKALVDGLVSFNSHLYFPLLIASVSMMEWAEFNLAKFPSPEGWLVNVKMISSSQVSFPSCSDGFLGAQSAAIWFLRLVVKNPSSPCSSTLQSGKRSFNSAVLICSIKSESTFQPLLSAVDVNVRLTVPSSFNVHPGLASGSNTALLVLPDASIYSGRVSVKVIFSYSLR